jgi:general secretion pathway protein D
MKPNAAVHLSRQWKTLRLVPVACVVLGFCLAIAGCRTAPTAPKEKKTWSSFDKTTGGTNSGTLIIGAIQFRSADVNQVLQVYQELSGRSVIRPTALPAVQISVSNQTPLSRVEALQLLDTALAQNGIAMVLSGDNAVKAVPVAQAGAESPPLITLRWQELPQSDSYMSYVVQLKNLKAVEVVAVLQPLAKTPHAIFPVASANQLMLRDYSSNIRRMLQVIENLEKSAPH